MQEIESYEPMKKSARKKSVNARDSMEVEVRSKKKQLTLTYSMMENITKKESKRKIELVPIPTPRVQILNPH